jgi:hypothetical protein
MKSLVGQQRDCERLEYELHCTRLYSSREILWRLTHADDPAVALARHAADLLDEAYVQRELARSALTLLHERTRERDAVQDRLNRLHHEFAELRAQLRRGRAA